MKIPYAFWGQSVSLQEILNGTPQPLIPTMSNNTSPYGVASASSTFNGITLAYAAFNGGATLPGGFQGWESASNGTQWLQYQFTKRRVITKYITSTQCTNAAFYVNTWTFQGSEDGNTWTILDTQNIVGITCGGTYNITNRIPYAYYRMVITAGGSTAYQVYTLQMYGF